VVHSESNSQQYAEPITTSDERLAVWGSRPRTSSPGPAQSEPNKKQKIGASRQFIPHQLAIDPLSISAVARERRYIVIASAEIVQIDHRVSPSRLPIAVASILQVTTTGDRDRVIVRSGTPACL
jgi:hypothetical protein